MTPSSIAAPLGPGAALGPYQILSKLGQGGMGVVWKGRDTRLGRDVALKVLPDEFTRDADRLARFEREAKTLASLNHPNIAQIYGLEVNGATRALVMELVEGPTLAERIGQAPIALDESLAIARQIAEALEDAHDKGIVHRDLKPQNVKVTADGKVKVLDFGLAKAMDPAGTNPAAALLTQSPTLSGTLHGTILGTAAYMAPEQAAGLAVDRRADIWVFGVVLYEMLTGRSLFEGETVTHVLAAVMKDEPDLAALPAATPLLVRDPLRRCLKKKPRERLQAIGDARLALGEAADPRRASPAQESATPQPLAARRSPFVAAIPWIIVAFVVMGAFALLRQRAGAGPGPTAATVRFTLLPTETGEIDGFPAISPDGRTLVYGLAAPSGVTRLYLHSFENGETRPLPGTEYAEDAFWSPDGRWIGGLRRQREGSRHEDHVRRIERRVLDTGRPRGLLLRGPARCWLLACRPADGSGQEEKVALRVNTANFDSASPREPLLAFDEISEQGGQDLWLQPLDGDRTARPFLQTPAAESHATFSPDGRLLAYASDESGLPQIYVQEIGGARSRWQVTTDGADEPAWRADGRELYYVGLDRTLYAAPVKSLTPFAVGAPAKLFPINMPLLAMSGNRSVYSPAPDGQRFLVNPRIGAGSEPGFRVIMNWNPPAR